MGSSVIFMVNHCEHASGSDLSYCSRNYSRISVLPSHEHAYA